MFSGQTRYMRNAALFGILASSFIAAAQEQAQRIFVKDMQSNPISVRCTLLIKQGKHIASYTTENGSFTVNAENNKRYDLIVSAKGYKRQSISQKIREGLIVTLPKDPTYIDTLAIATRARQEGREQGREEAARSYQPILQQAQDEAKRKADALAASQKRVAVLRDSVTQQGVMIKLLGTEVVALREQQEKTTSEVAELKTAVKAIQAAQNEQSKSIFSFLSKKKKTATQLKKATEFTSETTKTQTTPARENKVPSVTH